MCKNHGGESLEGVLGAMKPDGSVLCCRSETRAGLALGAVLEQAGTAAFRLLGLGR